MAIQCPYGSRQVINQCLSFHRGGVNGYDLLSAPGACVQRNAILAIPNLDWESSDFSEEYLNMISELGIINTL